MKRLLALGVLPGLALAGISAAVAVPAAEAGSCSIVSTTGTSATATCSGVGTFRAYVDCRRTSSSTYAYRSFGPERSSGGKSTASCSQMTGDYREGQGVQLT